MATKYLVAPASGSFTNFLGEEHMNNQHLRHAFFHRWLAADDFSTPTPCFLT
jgi:hypothetical protein